MKDYITANELVLDLLAAYEVHELPVSALCKAGSLFEISEQTLRVALTRLVKQGKIMQRERAIYAWNSSGHSLFSVVTNWINKEKDMILWDGSWIGILDNDISKTDKTAYSKHHRAMELYGFKKFKHSLSVRPNNLGGGIEKISKDLIKLGLSPKSLIIIISKLDVQEELKLRSLWNTQYLENSYNVMLKELDQSLIHLEQVSIAEAAKISLIQARKAINQLILDPLLPDELFDPTIRQKLLTLMTIYHNNTRKIWSKFLFDI